MKFSLKTLLSVLLILSTQSISMEVEHEQHNVPPNCLGNQVEGGYHYIPLCRVSDREEMLTILYFNVCFNMSNDLIPFLYTSGAQCYPCLHYPTAYVYLKVSQLAMKEIENIAHGNLPTGIKIVNQSYWLTPRFDTQERGLLNLVGKGLSISYIKGLSKSISAVAFDRPLPPEKVNSDPSLWSLKMSPRPMKLLRQHYPESYCENGDVEPCDIGSLLSFDPFDLVTERGTIPGIKMFMYPKFDFVESFSHIKDILLINTADMVYIINTPFQDLLKDVWGLIIKAYLSIVESEFMRTRKILYQSKPENIEYNQ